MHVEAKPYSALALGLAVAGLAACTAEVTDGQAGPGGPGGGGSAGTGVPIIKPLDCMAPVAMRAPMRRMTRFEYNNTVRDLLADTSLPANAFPSEISGNGFGNDADSQPVGPDLALEYINVSEKVAAAATAPDRIATLAPCASQVVATPDPAAEVACARTITETFLAKAFRRPLVAGEADTFVALFQAVRLTSDFATSVAAVLEGVLQSPEFLYKPEFGVPVAGRADVLQPTGDELATRLSFLFWASTPDDALRAAAASGQLATAGGVRTQAQRLLQDPRAREVIRHFFDKLLPISDLKSLERDPVEFPAFNPRVGSLMREETQKFLDHQIFSGATGAGTWPSVFTAGYTFVNQELAAFYGIPGVVGEAFQQVPLDTTKRAGLLTQAGVLAGPVHTNHANPVVRGSFVVQKLLCQPIPFPTGDIAAKVTPPDPNSAATARQRFTQHSLDPVCRSCHISMDPVGYALENFDVVGQWRAEENGVPIDATGDVALLGGAFNGAVELGQKLAASEQAQTCFATHWLNFGYGRIIRDTEACSVGSVQTKFKEAGYNVQELLLALTQSDSFLFLPAVRE